MGQITTKPAVEKLKHYVNWFEIPALDIHRAVAFYNHIYGIAMETVESNGYSMAFFPAERGIGGAVVMGQGSIPSETGTLVYLNGGPDLTPILNKIGAAGGRVVLEKTLINKKSGYFALFIDTEGNKLAIHSKN